MRVNWKIEVAGPPLGNLDLKEEFDILLGISRDFCEIELSATTDHVYISCFAQTILAIKQALGLKVLINADLADQAVNQLRSLYESLIYFTESMAINQDPMAHLLPPATKKESQQRTKSMLVHRRKMCKLYINYIRAVNWKALSDANDDIKEYQSKLKDVKSRARKSSDPVHKEELKVVQEQLSNRIMGLKRLVSKKRRAYREQYRSYKNKQGLKTVPQYWDCGGGPTKTAQKRFLDHRWMYRWCCNFSHSNFYAARVSLGHTADGKNVGYRSAREIETKLIFFAFWVLVNILEISCSILPPATALQKRVKEAIEKFEKKFKQANQR